MSEEIKAQKKDIWKVKFSQLVLHDNPRMDIVELTEIVMSIKAHGVIEPLSGYSMVGKYYVRNGKRRYCAMEIIWNSEGLDTECFFLIEPRGTTEVQGLLRQLIANSGKDLNPLEKGIAVKRFIEEFGWTINEVATNLQFSDVYIKRLLSLANAPDEFLEQVKNKTLSATFAMDMIAKGKSYVSDFLKTHKDGLGSTYEETEMFEEPEFKKKESKQAKITKKDLTDKTNIPNSWNEFKKYSDKADYLEMWEGKIYSPVDVFQFLLRLKNNEIVWDDIKDFFMASTEAKENKIKDDIKDIPTKKPINDNGETVVREYPK